MDKTEKFLGIMTSDKGYFAKQTDYMKGIQMKARKLTYELNRTSPEEEELRKNILKQLFEDENLDIWLIPPFNCDYGFNIHFEGKALINYNCSILDTSPVYIGNNVFIAPGVCITCAGHGIHPEDRIINTSKPIHIGKDVWIGANCTILAGVHIGDGSIIGAGSVVTSDIPDHVIAVGTPCKVLRSITEEDRLKMEEEIMYQSDVRK